MFLYVNTFCFIREVFRYKENNPKGTLLSLTKQQYLVIKRIEALFVCLLIEANIK